MNGDTDRELWPVKDIAAITEELRLADEHTRAHRAARLTFLLQEFGPPADMMLTGGLNGVLAISELQNSFLNGNFMATILLCQVFVESSLGGSYAFSGNEDTMLEGSTNLINRSASDNRVSSTLAGRIGVLQEMRNAYTHPRPYLNPRGGLLDRVVARKLRLNELAEQEAREAIQIVVDFLREGCPTWTPRTAESPA